MNTMIGWGSFRRFGINHFARRLLGLALLVAGAASSGQTPSGLVLWNRLGSSDQILTSSVGPGGTLASGSFVAGVFGSAVELTVPVNQFGVSFPFNVVPETNGCIEFWAKIDGLPVNIPNGYSPSLLKTTPKGPELGFAPNDGSANGGLCVNCNLGWVGSGGWGNWYYGQILGSGTVSSWHHYALVWSGTGNIPGVENTSRKVAVFVDGALNTFSGINNPNWFTMRMPDAVNLCLLGPSSTAINGVRVAFDNLKIWNYSKVDFSDRFSEGAGATPCTLTISGNPQNIGSPGPAGYGVSTNSPYDDIVNGVTPFVSDGSATRHVCTGWTGSGSVPATGTSNSVSFVITNNSTLVWEWRTEHLLAAYASDGGSVAGGGWYEAGDLVELMAISSNGFQFAGWSDGELSPSRMVVVPEGGAVYTANFDPLPRGFLRLQQFAYTVPEEVGEFPIGVERFGGSYGAASVVVTASNGSATAGSDYVLTPITLLWTNGQFGAQSVLVKVLDDDIHEGDENFFVHLENATGATLGEPNQATVTLIDDVDGTPVLPPTGLWASNGKYSDRVTIAWNAVPGATHYRVFRSETPAGPKTVLGPWRTETFYRNFNAIPGRIYYYFIRAAVGPTGDRASAYSAEQQGYRKLSAPTGIWASDGKYTDRVTIAWKVVPGATHYRVFRAEHPDPAGYKTALGPWRTATFYHNYNAIPGRTYYYFVQAAVNSTGARPGTFSTFNSGWRRGAMPEVR